MSSYYYYNVNKGLAHPVGLSLIMTFENLTKYKNEFLHTERRFVIQVIICLREITVQQSVDVIAQ